ncbi:MAG: complex I subunit 1/NuoH family protein [Actinomycetota bacterium]
MSLFLFLVIVAKVVVVFVALLLLVTFIVWFERKVVARMQSRLGPNRWGPFGLLTTLADGIKLFFKEPLLPRDADRATYLLAPVASLVPAFLTFAAIPFGPRVEVLGHRVGLEISDLNVGLLWVLAMGSLAVYGVVLAGWSSGSKYPLLGGIRSTAQMVSYEIAPLALARAGGDGRRHALAPGDRRGAGPAGGRYRLAGADRGHRRADPAVVHPAAVPRHS